MVRIGLIVLLSLAVLFGLAYVFRNDLIRLALAPQPPDAATLQGVSLADLPPTAVVPIAQDLSVPWEVGFLPGGDLLVSERPGRLLRIGQQGQRFEVEGVRHAGEGGLLGLAVHPEFERTGWVYLYFTTQTQEGLRNRVERYRLERDALAERTVLLQDIPGAAFHDGGRIAFGPDGHLYITTGDAGNSNAAQDVHSLAGKILRLTDAGGVPEDNPFGTPVYSYGHRNPQGLAWTDQGRLWSTEHGPSGLETGLDELNRILPGQNYGWPVIRGDETETGMVTPALHSGSDYTWAPAGAAFWDGSLFFGGLRGEGLYEARLLEDGPPQLSIHFAGELGRVRAVRLGPDGWLYLTTSNTDGRALPRDGDDRLLRVDPSVFR